MAKHRTSCWRRSPMSSSERQWNSSVEKNEIAGRASIHIVMPGLDPGIHAFVFAAKTWMAGTSPAMTKNVAVAVAPNSTLTLARVTLLADISGALFWDEQSLLIVSDLHLEKGSSFAARGILLPPYDTVATLSRLAAVIARHDPR